MARYNRGGYRFGKYRASLSFKGNRFIVSLISLFILFVMGDMVAKTLAATVSNIDNSTFKQAFNILGFTMVNTSGGSGGVTNLVGVSSNSMIGLVGVILVFGLLTSFVNIQRV